MAVNAAVLPPLADDFRLERIATRVEVRPKLLDGARPAGVVTRPQRVPAAQRARQISGGAELTLDRDRDKNPVVALREIAEETIRPEQLQEAVVQSLQRVQIDDDDEVDEVGSLAASAEALRLTAAAPPRNQNLGGDYDG